jgi:hypothetical protein
MGFRWVGIAVIVSGLQRTSKYSDARLPGDVVRPGLPAIIDVEYPQPRLRLHLRCASVVYRTHTQNPSVTSVPNAATPNAVPKGLDNVFCPNNEFGSSSQDGRPGLACSTPARFVPNTGQVGF